jgi:hypothetical protein
MPRGNLEKHARPLNCKCGNIGIAEYQETATPYPGGALESRLVRVTGDFKAKIGSKGPITCGVCGAQVGGS